MKISGLKYKVLLSIVSSLLLTIDIFLMAFYGFEGQLLLFLYIMIGIIPLCGVVALCSNMFIPTITFDYNSKTIITYFVANELYKNDRNIRNQGDEFYFDEITNCEIDNKIMIVTFKYGHKKILHLNFFTKNQIKRVKKEIENIIK